MNNNFHYFQNHECEFFPCHKIETKELKEKFSCFPFCFCPLYTYNDCGGKYTILESGIKDCSNCLLPHINYDYVIQKLIENNQKEGEK